MTDLTFHVEPDAWLPVAELIEDDLVALEKMKPGMWFYTIGRFSEVMERFERLGLVESGENPIPWAT